MIVCSNLSSQIMSQSPLREIYVSTDIETDGPVAGKHSLLSIGSAAYLADKELLGTFSANLETLPASAPDPKTDAWWATQPEAWSACRKNLEAPAVALNRYVAWLKTFGGRPVFVGAWGWKGCRGVILGAKGASVATEARLGHVYHIVFPYRDRPAVLPEMAQRFAWSRTSSWRSGFRLATLPSSPSGSRRENSSSLFPSSISSLLRRQVTESCR